MKLFVVTTGTFDDFELCGIYSSKPIAEWAQQLYAAENKIKELELDHLPEAPEGMLFFKVALDRDGNVKQLFHENAELFNRTREIAPYGDGKHMSFDIWATDEDHALAIANERRISLLASGQWQT